MQGVNEIQMAEKKERQFAVLVLQKINVRLNKCLATIAGLAMVLMSFLIVANVIIRIFYVPIPGINEMVGWFAAITASFALGYTQIHRGHVDMEVLVEKFPPRWKNRVRGFMLLISMLFFVMISYELIVYANQVRENGTLSETLAMIYYPFIYLLAVGFFGLTFSLLVDSIQFFMKGDRP